MKVGYQGKPKSSNVQNAIRNTGTNLEFVNPTTTKRNDPHLQS